jgi:hypothetical protein
MKVWDTPCDLEFPGHKGPLFGPSFSCPPFSAIAAWTAMSMGLFQIPGSAPSCFDGKDEVLGVL